MLIRRLAHTVPWLALAIMLAQGCTLGAPDHVDDAAGGSNTASAPDSSPADIGGSRLGSPSDRAERDTTSSNATSDPDSSQSARWSPNQPLPLSLPFADSGASRQSSTAGTESVAADERDADADSGVPVYDDGCAPGLARRDGDSLVVNGQTFAFFGVNASYLLNADFPESRVEGELAALARRNVNAVRIWFLPGYDPDRLERTLDAGARQGIRFVVTLDDNVQQNRHWFFGDEDEQVFRPHVKDTVSRFRDREEILMWEPTNEANCHDDYDAACVEDIKDWLTMASRLIKSEDSCHLVSSGVIGAGNYERDLIAYRGLHEDGSIDVLSVHRGVEEERERETATADELGMPIVHGEIYDVAYDESCSPLDGGKAMKRRAERVKDDFRDVLRDGVDGYLLWDYAAGSIEMPNGTQRHFCSVFGYELTDPLWRVMAEADLPPPVPWQQSPDG